MSGRVCVDQILTLRIIVEQMLGKKNCVQYAAFIYLEKAYDRIDWEAMWDVMRVHEVDGKFL